jgi:dihydropteroate synthase
MTFDVRISGDDTLAITIQDLSVENAAFVRDIVRCMDGSIAVSIVNRANRKAAIVTGPPDRLKLLPDALRSNPHVPAELPDAIQAPLERHVRTEFLLDCRGIELDLGRRTHIMGVLNATPDSFSDGGKFVDLDAAFLHAWKMAAAGADIIDVGGESTRPGAAPVSEREEQRRIVPLIEQLAKELDTPISVDTYKSSVAEKALEAGASIVNDISGLRFSPDMARVVADFGAAVVIMHIKGTPRDMQKNPVYDDVVAEVRRYLEESVERALAAGIGESRIVIDPGIGFGKSLEHNLELLNRLDEFRSLGRPILIGTSRKKFIGTVLGVDDPEQRGDGTAATIALGIARGARMVRVHDVQRMAHVARMTDAVLKSKR